MLRKVVLAHMPAASVALCCSRFRWQARAVLALFAEAKGALAILTGNRDLWSDACALWVQVSVAASLCP